MKVDAENSKFEYHELLRLFIGLFNSISFFHGYHGINNFFNTRLRFLILKFIRLRLLILKFIRLKF